jgi:hypothetical protein
MTPGTFSGNCSVASAMMRLDLPVPESPITTTRTPDLPARFAGGAITPAMARRPPPLGLPRTLELGFCGIWALRRGVSAGGVGKVGWLVSYVGKVASAWSRRNRRQTSSSAC